MTRRVLALLGAALEFRPEIAMNTIRGSSGGLACRYGWSFGFSARGRGYSGGAAGLALAGAKAHPSPKMSFAFSLTPSLDDGVAGGQVAGVSRLRLRLHRTLRARPVAAGACGRHGRGTLAGRLASVDYSALSLPAFTTVTSSLNLTLQDFTGDQLRLDSTGEVSGEKRWAIYSWRGPDVPPLPDRPLVSRWVQVYALYDLKANKVVRLIATVRGEAHE